MKQTNIKYYVISVFVVISLICVGFATWTQIKMFDEDKVEGSINADPVVKTDEYLDFDRSFGNGTGILCFQYHEEGGFVNYLLNSTAINYSETEAKIFLYYKLAPGKYAEIFGSDKITVAIEVSLAGGKNLATFADGNTVFSVYGGEKYDAGFATANTLNSVKTNETNILLSFDVATSKISETEETLMAVEIIFNGKNIDQAAFRAAINGTPFNFNTRIS